METISTLIIGAGQAGLATAHQLNQVGISPVVFEASERTVGSWAGYYDSLTLFSPARYSSLPGMPFPGDPKRYPHRDEVVDYLEAYARTLDADIRTNHEVVAITDAGKALHVELSDGRVVAAGHVIAATGSFRRPFTPKIPGLDTFGGRVVHAADYRNPDQLASRNVVVVGAGNSAVQIAVELAETTNVTLATREDVRFAPQFILGHDFHEWAVRTGVVRLKTPKWLQGSGSARVLDVGTYRAALDAGQPIRRAMFDRIETDHVVWPDGTTTSCDAIVFATGYRPAVDYLEPLGALDDQGVPLHRGGISTTVPRLSYVGLSGQRTFASAAFLGVGRDARHIARHVRRASKSTVTSMNPAHTSLKAVTR